MRALVVGFGSIGVRHARLLAGLGCDVGVVSEREVPHALRFRTLREALDCHVPGYVVLASATNLHAPQLAELGRAGFSGLVLVEKPLFNVAVAPSELPIGAVYVAYNLRFHPLITALRSRLVGERILSVQAYAGQYLPFWRPSADYRASYSASAKRGGGVLRDLSHEIDYLTWMFGRWTRLAALGGRFSDLEIDSEDVFTCLFGTSDCPVVSVELNYLDREGRRRVLVNTATRTFEADFGRGTLTIDGDVHSFAADRDESYRAMHHALLAGEAHVACTYEEGLRTLRFIEAAEASVAGQQWVANE